MSSLHRSKYGTTHNLRSVVFICDAPAAAAVTLIGDFNHWNTHSHPLQKQPDGGWLLRMEMKHGHHRYAYLVDGALTLGTWQQIMLLEFDTRPRTRQYVIQIVGE